ncbi:hypothetical protein [Thioalkalivibrio sulfidiphilus]|nr:hypothetical protein [Thioalkalivibrio sulfidiphilus]
MITLWTNMQGVMDSGVYTHGETEHPPDLTYLQDPSWCSPFAITAPGGDWGARLAMDIGVTWCTRAASTPPHGTLAPAGRVLLLYEPVQDAATEIFGIRAATQSNGRVRAFRIGSDLRIQIQWAEFGVILERNYPIPTGLTWIEIVWDITVDTPDLADGLRCRVWPFGASVPALDAPTVVVGTAGTYDPLVQLSLGNGDAETPWLVGQIIVSDDPGEDLSAYVDTIVYPGEGPGDALDVGGAYHSLRSPEIQLIQGHVLSVGGVRHGHTAEAADLVQAAVLAVAGALHGHTSGSPALSQAATLTVAGALHGHTAAAVVLTQAGLLDVLAAWHGHTSTAPAVTTEAMLDVGAAHHGHFAQDAQLTQAHLLVVGDAVHGHRVESVTLSEALLLEIGSALHGHTVQGVALTQGHVLAVAGAVHALTSDAIDGMPTDAVLVVDNAVHAHIAQQVALFDPLATVDLGNRIFVVQAEDRLFVVQAEDRIGRVH